MFGFEKGSITSGDLERERKIKNVKQFLADQTIEITRDGGAEFHEENPEMVKMLQASESGDFGPVFEFLLQEETRVLHRINEQEQKGLPTDGTQKYLSQVRGLMNDLHLEER